MWIIYELSNKETLEIFTRRFHSSIRCASNLLIPKKKETKQKKKGLIISVVLKARFKFA